MVSIRSRHSLSIRQGCRLLGLAGSTVHYKSRKIRSDTELIATLQEAVALKFKWGLGLLTDWMKRSRGVTDNHKRIARVYRELGLQLHKRKGKRRKMKRERVLLPAPEKPNDLWAMDFVQDSFATGRKFRVLAVKDLFTHEAVCLWTDRSIPGERVAEALDWIKARRGALPKHIICDNGSEFTSRAMDQWCYKNGVDLKFIQPGKPTQNAFIESFNGKFRSECLNQHWFETLEEAKETIETWRIEYNTERPNRAIGRRTPEEFAKEQERLLYG